MTENEMVEWHHQLDGHEFEQAPGAGNGTPLQYFCLENPMEGGASQAAAMGLGRVGHD